MVNKNAVSANVKRKGILATGAKMNNTGIFMGMFVIMMLFGTFTVNAQTFSKNFNANYQIFGFDSLGYPEKPTAKALFLDNNFINQTGGDGTKAICENKSTTNGVFTATLLYCFRNVNIIKPQVIMLL